MNDSLYMILNGELVTEQAAAISPLNRGMMYGDGCFETLRSYSGHLLGWDQHFDRLSGGLKYLGMEFPYTAQELKSQIEKLLEQNRLDHEEAMVRIQCWRDGERGYASSSRKADWMIQARKFNSKDAKLTLATVKTRCIPSEALERKYKLSNGLNYIKAAQEAHERSCDDALMLTVNDKISEATTANIFWIKDGQICTPSEECDLLPGVTRSIVMDVIRSLGIPLKEVESNRHEIEHAEAAFCTNSLIEIREVSALNDIQFELDHPLVMKVKVGFEQFKVKEFEK